MRSNWNATGVSEETSTGKNGGRMMRRGTDGLSYSLGNIVLTVTQGGMMTKLPSLVEGAEYEVRSLFPRKVLVYVGLVRF